MTVTNPALPLYAADVERTCLPLEQATMLPGAAFTDSAVLEWERANFFRRGWICAGHIEQVASRGRVPDGRRRRRERARRRRRRRPPARVPEHLPPPRRAAGRRARGHAPAHPVPVPRVDLRLRRHAARARRSPRAWSTSTRSASRCTRSGSRSSRASCCSTSPARRRRRRTHVGDLAPLLAALPPRRAASAARGSSTTSTPTGRRSPRTTASACTARACTRSSTGSRTTSAARRSRARAPWCGGSMTLAEGVETMATDGGHGRKPIDGVDLRSILYFLIFPNTLVSLHPDYVMLHTLWPKAPGPHRGRLRVVLRARGDRRAGLRPDRRGRVLGPGQPRGLARLRAHAARDGVAARSRPAATRRRRTTCTRST